MPDSQTDRRIRLVQVTDCHLYSDPHGDLLGLVTLDSLHAVADDIQNRSLNAPVVVATGDLVHDGSADGYREMARTMQRLGNETLALPGNHDDIPVMKAIMEELGVQHCGHLDIGNWRLILLDTQLPGKEKGYLSNSELERLKRALDIEDRHSLIFLHHQPVPVGSHWIDQIGLENADAFWQCLEQCASSVRGVAWGHVHQAWDGERHSIKLCATPSTCIQFTPNKDTFGIAMTPPGWRSFELYPDGRLDSKVHYLSEMPPGVSMNSNGYI